jgi:hypothetical protein
VENTCSCNPDHVTGCLVCGEELIYSAAAEKVQCMICEKEEESNARCARGHYICDACHRGNILALVEQVCLASTATDPVEIALRIFQLPGLHMHGPEYHSIVPAVLVTAYGNMVQDKREQAIKEAIKRGKEIKGGSCGNNGACGAGIGVGIAYSVLHGVTPLSKERGPANRMTALALMEISRTGGARCCKRDVMVALATAKRHFAELDHTVGSKYVCEQYPQNKQCIRSECPYYPG